VRESSNRGKKAGVSRSIEYTALLVLGLFACKPAPVAPPDVSTLPKPEAALAELRAGGAERKSLRSEGRVTYFGDQGRVRLKAILLAERPGRFRIETISPFEQPIDVMACDGSRLWLLSNNRLREGPATPENIARLLPLPLYPEEVVDVLLGGVPSGDRFTASTIEPAPDGQWYLGLVGAGGERAKLTVDPVRKVVLRTALLELDGSDRVTVDFADFAQPQGAKDAREMPEEIVVKVPARKMEVTIKLTRSEVDATIDGGLFRLAAPSGVVVEPLDSPGVQVR
jgi:outer membrane lipoprotein-sorting protein